MARKKKPRKSVDSQSNAIPSADPATQEKEAPKTSTVPTMSATSSDTLEENTTFEDKSHSAPMFCTTQMVSSDGAVQCSSTQFSAKYSFYSNKEAESVGERSCL